MIVTIDFETRCAADIQACGPWKYAEDPTCTPICCAFQVDDQPPGIWVNDWVFDCIDAENLLSICPSVVVSTKGLCLIVEEADKIEAHNAEFERAIWHHHMPGELPIHKVHCTAARAAMAALPRALAYVCQVLKLPMQKDTEGGRIMKQVSLPKKDGTWDNDPMKLLKTIQYCLQDVRAERALSKVLPELPPSERAVWLLDQKINGRGIQIDTRGARDLINLVDGHVAKLLAEFRTITQGNPESPTQVQKFLDWCKMMGVELDNMQAEPVDKVIKTLEDGNPVRRALQIRRSVSKSSVAKFHAMLARAQNDGRARSLFMYHGAGTGRWSGAGIQPQNLPSRKVFKQPEIVLDMLRDGRSAEFIEMTCGDPMWLASSCIRSCITATPGKTLFCGDYKSIEGRGLAWLAGEEYILQAYRAGADLYKVAAAGIYGRPVEEIKDGSFERQIGKVVELACIEATQLVRTERGAVPIKEVTPEDKVFDGVDFVNHGGVVYRGIKEVIEYDGLIATPDHIVFIEAEGERREVSFGLAAQSGSRIVSFYPGRRAVRLGEDYIAKSSLHAGVVWRVRVDTMRSVPVLSVDVLGCSDSGEESWVPTMQSADTGLSEMAIQALNGGEIKVPEPQRQRVSKLWWPWDRIPVCERTGRVQTPGRCLWNSRPGNADRSNRQHGPLRTRKYPILHTGRESRQSAEKSPPPTFRSISMALRPKHGQSKTPGGQNPGADSFGSRTGGSGEAQGVGTNKRFAPVYDILNCGPRNRFVVSGKLVHNCGYQGGIGALSRMADSYGVQLPPPEETKQIIKSWRDSRPATTKLWRDMEKAAIMSIRNPGQIVTCGKIIYKTAKGALMMKLPSGRCLYYQNPTIGTKKVPWLSDDGQEQFALCISFWGVDSTTKQWCEQTTYGGCLTENAVQALCRDLLVYGMQCVEASGKYEVVLHCHDECLSEAEDGDLEEYLTLLTQKPDWAAGIPVVAEGWTGFRYKKG